MDETTLNTNDRVWNTGNIPEKWRIVIIMPEGHQKL